MPSSGCLLTDSAVSVRKAGSAGEIVHEASEWSAVSMDRHANVTASELQDCTVISEGACFVEAIVPAERQQALWLTASGLIYRNKLTVE